jgi:tetratricopeptide (TPR) repeat protein
LQRFSDLFLKKRTENNKKHNNIMANNQNQGVESNEALLKSEAFINKNKKPLLIILVALLVIIGGTFAYKGLISNPRNEKASTILGKGQEYFNQEQFEVALNGDKAGYIGFVQIADEYGSTDAGNLAKLYAGLCYANLGKWQQAEEYLEKYSTSSDAMVSPAATAALGDAYAHLNQLDKAVDCFKKAASMADGEAEDGTNNSLSPTFLLKAGKILESQGKNADALDIYKDIKAKYVNSALVVSSEIDKYIERATLNK